MFTYNSKTEVYPKSYLHMNELGDMLKVKEVK